MRPNNAATKLFCLLLTAWRSKVLPPIGVLSFDVPGDGNRSIAISVCATLSRVDNRRFSRTIPRLYTGPSLKQKP
ncbi:hypothetical protein BDW68DRAFT_172190, partial [Aspergillus falconensis]